MVNQFFRSFCKELCQNSKIRLFVSDQITYTVTKTQRWVRRSFCKSPEICPFVYFIFYFYGNFVRYQESYFRYVSEEWKYLLIFWSKYECFLKIRNTFILSQKGPFGDGIPSIHFMLLDKRHLFAVGCLSVTSNVSLTLLYTSTWLFIKRLRDYQLLLYVLSCCFLYLRRTVHVFALWSCNKATADKVFVWSLLLEVIPKWINEEW